MKLTNDDRIIGSIYESYNYEKFEFIEGNRDPHDRKLKAHQNNLKQLIKQGYVLTPIEVTEDFKIIDGQNRYMAHKDLNMPIRYFYGNLFDDMQLGIQNGEGNKDWSVDDHINFFATKGNLNFIKLRDFMKKTSYPTALSMRVLSDGKHTKPMSLKTGDFQATNEEVAQKFFEEVSNRLEERPALYVLESIYKLWRLDERVKLDRLIDIYLANKSVIKETRTFEVCLKFFVEKYNYKLSKENRIKVGGGKVTKYFL